jgi:ribosomal protein S18 acetylase RimI-like enzyme
MSPTKVIRTFEDKDKEKVIHLWTACGLVSPSNDPALDIERKKRVQRELFLVASAGDEILGTVMAGYEGHRGWINYLAVSPDEQKAGLGRALMLEAERLLRAIGCPKINLQVRTSNAEVRAFYEKIGFSEDAVVSFGKRLI